ncbi:MAG: DinB family protein [Bryobacteraceae bacterium]
MPHQDPLREHLVQLLEGGHAHTSFYQATRGFPIGRAGVRPAGAPYSAWELVEHMRIAQNDILRFCQSAEYRSPEWPRGYWPASPAPEREEQWKDSLRHFRDDLAEFLTMVRDPASDLYRKLPWGDGQTLLREALLIADHNAYHLGQLVLVRRLLGAWEE